MYHCRFVEMRCLINITNFAVSIFKFIYNACYRIKQYFILIWKRRNFWLMKTIPNRVSSLQNLLIKSLITNWTIFESSPKYLSFKIFCTCLLLFCIDISWNNNKSVKMSSFNRSALASLLFQSVHFNCFTLWPLLHVSFVHKS